LVIIKTHLTEQTPQLTEQTQFGHRQTQLLRAGIRLLNTYIHFTTYCPADTNDWQWGGLIARCITAATQKWRI